MKNLFEVLTSAFFGFFCHQNVSVLVLPFFLVLTSQAQKTIKIDEQLKNNSQPMIVKRKGISVIGMYVWLRDDLEAPLKFVLANGASAMLIKDF